MQISTQDIFEDLKKGTSDSVYLIVGSEPFQVSEVLNAFKTSLMKHGDESFDFEKFSAERLEADKLSNALETIPSLFGGGGSRLVFISQWEKANAAIVGLVEAFVKNPAEGTCLVLCAGKVDKRKSSYRSLSKKAKILEVREPYDREWPKWKTYIERKCGKKIEPRAWEGLLEVAERKLSLVWSESVKVATFVGERSSIYLDDVNHFAYGLEPGSVFEFIDDVCSGRSYVVARKYRELVRKGEHEVKLLSLLVRQFRMFHTYHGLDRSAHDNRVVASELGVAPFLVGKVVGQAKLHSPEEVRQALHLLADCDFKIKTGGGNLYENFLIPYLSSKRASRDHVA